MRVLVSAAWLGGVGGAERALHSIVRALADDDVDLVVRERLPGRYGEVAPRVRVFSLYDWRWRAAAMTAGMKGALVQKAVNPVRRKLLPRYDVYLQLFSGPNLNRTIHAGVRLLIPSGNQVPPQLAADFDAVALQAPDNARFVPEGVRSVVLPPPVYDVAERAEPPAVPLPERFYLTVFNPYGDIKGTDDVERIANTAPHPVVWCHSQATVRHSIPDVLVHHQRIVHVEDATGEQLRYLYEKCDGYVSLSRSEGFGWSIADALRYAPKLFARKVGVLTFPEATHDSNCQLSEDLDFNWDAASAAHGVEHRSANRSLSFVSATQFRCRLLATLEQAEESRAGVTRTASGYRDS